jgi:hypothetical protein
VTVTFHTVVLDLAPTPLGLLGRRFVVRHRCSQCSATVETTGLVDHARSHAGGPHEGGAID